MKQLLEFYDSLTEQEKEDLSKSAMTNKYSRGKTFLKGSNDCTGLIVVKSGQIRVFTISDKGKEITLYRLHQGDACILSASCVLNNIDFEVSLTVEKDCELVIIPTKVFGKLGKNNIAVSQYITSLMANRFSDVVWVLQQYVFNGTANRIAGLLVDSEKNGIVEITHESIANETGTAREVVTRLLKKMQDDGIISLSRGKIEILKKKELLQI